ncbi:MAG: TolC family protein [Gemmatimonadota bacterium]|nr:TolC family protein [Gemmatimonadota bacterium]MDE2829748.1 TolC family protein [Gemmatimonadota bacterium]
MMRFRYIAVLAIIFAHVNTSAQEERREMRLTLNECVEISLTSSAQIEQFKYTVAISETLVDNARNSFLPNTSSVNWGISRNVQGPREGQVLDPSTGTLVQLLGEDRVSGAQSFRVTGLTMPVYDGRLISQLSSAKNSLMQTQMQQTGNRQTIIFQTKQRYFQLLQTIKLLEVQQERVRVSEESLRRAETLYEIGSAAILQVTNARSNLAGLRATLIQRENDVRIAQSNLAFTMGLGTDVDIIPSEEEFELLSPQYSESDALSIALAEHPDILDSKYGMLSSRDDYNATKKGLYHPRITMSTNAYSWSLGKDEDFGGPEDIFLKNYSYGISLNVTMPLFNFNTSNTLKRLKLQYLRSQEQLDQAKRQKALTIRQRYLNLERFRRLIEANEVAVEAAEENFKLEEERYNFGGGTFLERLTAQRDLFDARNNLVQSKYNYLIEMANLENEVGTPVVGNPE